jgi:hypothetical protein
MLRRSLIYFTYLTCYTYSLNSDVIGYLVKYEAAKTFVPKNKEKAKTLREIYIKDLRCVYKITCPLTVTYVSNASSELYINRDNIIKITLWGPHATEFDIKNIYDPEAGNLIVCLIVGCIPREDIMDNGNAMAIPMISTVFCPLN